MSWRAARITVRHGIATSPLRLLVMTARSLRSRPAVLCLILLVAGCASTPQTSHEQDTDAKQFGTHPNAGTIYVYRTEFDHLEDQTVLYANGRLIGATLPGTYFRLDLPPGRHLLHGIAADTGRITLDTRIGELYFVELTVVEAQSNFRLVSDEVGRSRIVKCCALLENWAPGQRPLLR